MVLSAMSSAALAAALLGAALVLQGCGTTGGRFECTYEDKGTNKKYEYEATCESKGKIKIKWTATGGGTDSGEETFELEAGDEECNQESIDKLKKRYCEKSPSKIADEAEKSKPELLFATSKEFQVIDDGAVADQEARAKPATSVGLREKLLLVGAGGLIMAAGALAYHWAAKKRWQAREAAPQTKTKPAVELSGAAGAQTEEA